MTLEEFIETFESDNVNIYVYPPQLRFHVNIGGEFIDKESEIYKEFIEAFGKHQIKRWTLKDNKDIHVTLKGGDE